MVLSWGGGGGFEIKCVQGVYFQGFLGVESLRAWSFEIKTFPLRGGRVVLEFYWSSGFRGFRVPL